MTCGHQRISFISVTFYVFLSILFLQREASTYDSKSAKQKTTTNRIRMSIRPNKFVFLASLEEVKTKI